MWSRVLTLTRAQLSGEWYSERGSRLPIAPVLFQMTIAAVLCGIARDILPPLPYAIFALAVPLGLGALALFGELAPLLRSDPASEWIGAQPVRPLELRLSRVCVLAILLGALSLGALLPAAFLAPSEMSATSRVGLVFAGLLQTLGLAGGLLTVQAVCAGRAEGVLVLLHTITFVLVLVGFAAGLGQIQAFAAVTEPSGALLVVPSTWYGSLAVPTSTTGVLFGAAAVLLSLLALSFAPFPPKPKAQRTGSILGLLLTPVRRLAATFWVTKQERASFEFVWDALPAERDFVTRAYPLLAVPLAFLLLGAEGGTEKGEGLLAISLFTPAIYLPVLLMHVPATASASARWIVDMAPVEAHHEASGARKAIALRLLLPLFLALGAMAYARGDLGLALRLTPIAFAATLLLQRVIWPVYVSRPPLSTPASDVGGVWDETSSGGMLGIAIGSALLAILAWRRVESPWVALGVLVGALVLERLPARKISTAT